MSKSFISASCIALVFLLSACSSSPRKELVLPPELTQGAEQTGEKSTEPVLNEQDKAEYFSAVSALKAGELDDAEIKFKALLDKQPRLAGALVNLGLIEKSRKNQEESKAYFKKALAINSNNVAALVQLGGFAQAEGRFKEAEAFYLKAYSQDNNHSIVAYNLGVLYELYLQDYGQAVKYYERYVSIGVGDDIEKVKRWIKLLERK